MTKDFVGPGGGGSDDDDSSVVLLLLLLSIKNTHNAAAIPPIAIPIIVLRLLKIRL